MEKKISPTATIPMIEESVEADQAEAARTEVPVPTESTIEDSSSKGSKDFSPEERATIIAMAREVGFAKVALEFGIKARLISYWVQQEKKKSSKPRKPTAAKGKGTLSREKEAEHMEDTPTLAAEPAKAVEPAVRMSERTVSADVQGAAEVQGSAEPVERSEGKQALTDRKTMTDEHVLIDRQSLIIENAILKERITLLNAEIEKLRAALTSLM